MMKPNTDWNGTREVNTGDVCRIRDTGFGRNTCARVLSVSTLGWCEVQITKVGKTGAGWVPGNRVTIHAAKLEVQ